METTRTSEAPRSTPAEGPRSTRRADAGPAGSGSPQDAFSSLLAAMEDSAAPLVETQVQGDGMTSESDEPSLVAESGSAVWVPIGASQPVAEWMGLTGRMPQGGELSNVAGSFDVAPSLVSGVHSDMVSGVAEGVGGAGRAGEVLEGALISQTAQMDRTQVFAADVVPNAELASLPARGGARPTVSRWIGAGQQRVAAETSGVLPAATAALTSSLVGKKGAIASAVADNPLNAAQVGGGGRTGSSVSATEMRLGSGNAEAAGLAAPVLQAVVGALAEMSAQARQGTRASEGTGSVTSAPASLADASNGSLAESLSMAADGAAVTPDGATAAGDGVQAEPVAFWVNQKTQNAELTLDGDGQPVEVRVSLTGNEAHVTFRSDQAQTREALDASMAQLRDLLQQEGVVLTGVTVGSSGMQGDGGRGAQPGRHGVQQGRVVEAQGEPAEGGGRARAVGQGGASAVDIFV